MRVESYAQELEDVVLYCVLRDVDSCFYIDVGANDPTFFSVTKLFYLNGGSGINIEPLQSKCLLLHEQRPRDINLCIGIGEKKGTKMLAAAGFLSSFSEEIKRGHPNAKEYEKEIYTLSDIYRKYCEKKIVHFCKIDVEGYEKEVLSGIENWEEFRPWVYVIESVEPGTNIPSYQKWEKYLLENGYIHAYSSGINRFYVAREYEYLLKRFDEVQGFIKTNQILKLEAKEI